MTSPSWATSVGSPPLRVLRMTSVTLLVSVSCAIFLRVLPTPYATIWRAVISSSMLCSRLLPALHPPVPLPATPTPPPLFPVPAICAPSLPRARVRTRLLPNRPSALPHRRPRHIRWLLLTPPACLSIPRSGQLSPPGTTCLLQGQTGGVPLPGTACPHLAIPH